MNGVYARITGLIASFASVTNLIGQNTEYTDPADRYAIRPGQLNEDDPLPGIVLALPSVQVSQDLPGIDRHLAVTLEVRCLSLSLSECWNLRSSVAYDTGTPNASTGLHTATAAGILSCQHTGDTEDVIDFGDDSDRTLFVVTSTYELEVSEGDL